MSRFHDPDRSGSRGDGDAEAQDESATHHLSFGSIGGRETLDDGADDDTKAADEHARATAPLVDAGSDEGQGADSADLVHGGDEAGPDTFVLAVEMLEEVFFVVEETAEQHGVVPVHGLAEEAGQKDEKQEQ